MHCFYSPELPLSGAFTFSETESKHAVQVLRMTEGTEVIVTNGKGLVCLCELTKVHKKHSEASVIKAEQKNAPTANFHLYVAPPKSNDRWHFILEKAQELGVSTITPIKTYHSERKNINEEKGKQVLISALKQCRSGILTELKPFVALDKISFPDSETLKLVASCSTGLPASNLPSVLEKDKTVSFLIGPEGDFSKEEITLLSQQGFVNCSLGTTILRTETACVFAASSFKMINL